MKLCFRLELITLIDRDSWIIHVLEACIVADEHSLLKRNVTSIRHFSSFSSLFFGHGLRNIPPADNIDLQYLWP